MRVINVRRSDNDIQFRYFVSDSTGITAIFNTATMSVLSGGGECDATAEVINDPGKGSYRLCCLLGI
jgi:hypothetical protein